MKLKYILSVGLLTAFAFNISSCDDFLTEKNPNTITTDIYFESLSDCESALVGVYNAFKSTKIYQPVDENLRSDIAVQGNKNRVNFDNDAYMQRFTNSSATANDEWADMYTVIYRCNQVLEGLDVVKPKISSSELTSWKQIKGQALFFRGLFYFYLSNAFNNGAVPINTTVPKTTDEFYKPVSTAEQVKEFYRNDLNEAINLGLPDSWDDKNRGRATSGAAKSVLGMSYLYDKDYSTAATYFKQVIDSKKYELVDFVDNITEANEFNKESILEVSYSNTTNTQYSGDGSLYNTWGMLFSKAKGWLAAVPAFWLVEEFENEKVDSLDKRNWIEVSHDDIRYQSTEAANNEQYNYGYDVIYEQLGDKFVASSTDEKTGNTTNIAYVYHQFPNTYEYRNILQKRTIVVDANGNRVGDVKYEIAGKNVLERPLKIFTVDGKMYRLRFYSMRASYSIALNGDEDVPYYKTTCQIKAAYHNRESGYFRKLTNWATRETEPEASPVNSSGLNLHLIRLADIYLLYAESLIKGGSDDSQLSEALKYVNEVRHRSGLILIGSENDPNAKYKGTATYEDTEKDKLVDGELLSVIDNAQKLMNHLMYVERPMELNIEGYATRVFDLRRWGITKQRFQELSKKKYVLKQVDFIKDDVDKGLTKASNWGKQYPASLYPGEDSYSDYEHAALNYNESKAYWPIPNQEVMANPYITNNK